MRCSASTSASSPLPCERRAQRPDETPPLIGIRMKARLGGRALRRVVGLMEEIGRVVGDANRGAGSGRTFAVTLVLAPTEDKTTL